MVYDDRCSVKSCGKGGNTIKLRHPIACAKNKCGDVKKCGAKSRGNNPNLFK